MIIRAAGSIHLAMTRCLALGTLVDHQGTTMTATLSLVQKALVTASVTTRHLVSIV